MNATREAAAEAESDLERTAELPQLDAATIEAAQSAHESGLADTWVAPGPAAPPVPAAVEPVPAQLADTASAAGVVELEARLERAERALALRELATHALEARGAELAVEAERLRSELREMDAVRAAQQAALAERDARIAQLEIAAREPLAAAGRVASLEAELGALRERMHRYLESLQSLEGRRALYEEIYSELDSEAAIASARALRLTADCARLGAERDALAGLAPRVRQLEAELEAEREASRSFRDDTRILLDQREARIRSLESEAVSVVLAPASGTPASGTSASDAPAGDADGVAPPPPPPTAPTVAVPPVAVPRCAEAAVGMEPALEGATRLLIHRDGGAEVVHVLGRRTTIGRTPDNDLQLDTRFISRHHAVILCGPVYTIIEDLNSTNGVLVNDQRVARHALQDGDAVTIGRSQFHFVVHAAANRG